MNNRKRSIVTGLLAYILSPILVSIGFIVSSMMNVSEVIFSYILLVIFWLIYGYLGKQERKLSESIKPHFVVFCFYMLVWIAIFGWAGYRYDSQYFAIYFWLTLPYAALNLMLSFMNNLGIIPFMFIAVFVLQAIAILLGNMLAKRNMFVDRGIGLIAAICVLLSGISTYQMYDRNNKFLSSDPQAERVSDEVDLSLYQPFAKSNQLKRLDDPATLMIGNHYPRLDGATAAFPVYGAIVQEIYKGLNESGVNDFVQCTKTNVAYQRLIDNEIDIFFGAQPSSEQRQQAKDKGIVFTMTPIAKEAFVFFVNVENPVNSLTLQEIQDVYQKKITNWKQLGGNDEAILPFQRPVNSGSQTIMLAKVMKDKTLPKPLYEEYAEGMGGIISEVASYRNYTSSIGYSFRYYATGMKSNSNIKLLAIDGIEPTVENIRNGTYPFTVDVYAVTSGSTNKNTQLLIDWILSAQGQAFIEKIGYVGVQ